ncbi:hypothetical protein ABZ135_23275 [Streptomyces sp. NPDC006339]|uniref:hypothetical protein n=1 Tax=Streptomyces sp. NPDC006339 TaxID=3156755 RepID=UPI0033B937A6
MASTKIEMQRAESMIEELRSDKRRYAAWNDMDRYTWACQELGWWERHLKRLKAS